MRATGSALFLSAVARRKKNTGDVMLSASPSYLIFEAFTQTLLASGTVKDLLQWQTVQQRRSEREPVTLGGENITFRFDRIK